MFGWLLGHNGVLSKVNLARRNLCINVKCSQCEVNEETTLHLFRDCIIAKKLWHEIVPSPAWNLFFNCDYKEWIYLNLNHKELTWNDVEWGKVFLVVCWWLWRWMNNVVFNGEKPPPDLVSWIQHKIEVWNAFKERREFSTATKQIPICWKAQHEGWCKLNTNGAAQGNPGIASCGGVLRDWNGVWITGFAANLGFCTSVEAEI